MPIWPPISTPGSAPALSRLGWGGGYQSQYPTPSAPRPRAPLRKPGAPRPADLELVTSRLVEDYI